MKKLISFVFLFIFCSGACLAQTTIVGLKKALKEVKKEVSVPILFPLYVPPLNQPKTYYASSSISKKKNMPVYQINVDATPNCQGVHNCNIGSISAMINAKPSFYRDMNNKIITEKVKLKGGKIGFYTPAHAMGDYWPGMISWRYQNVLYTITWQLQPATEKVTLVNMANSTFEYKG